jgi:hypothetical protein
MLISSGKIEADILENTREPVVSGCRHRRNTLNLMDRPTSGVNRMPLDPIYPAYHTNQLTRIPSRTYFSCYDEHHTMIALYDDRTERKCLVEFRKRSSGNIDAGTGGKRVAECANLINISAP